MATQARNTQGGATVAYDFNQGTSAPGNKGLYRENDRYVFNTEYTP